MSKAGHIFLSFALLLAIGSCSTNQAASDEIRVSAAASLSDSFEAMAVAFEAEHRGVEVVLNLAGSSTLREQILGGAPTDVFASANLSFMNEVDYVGAVVGEIEVVAMNQLVIAVPAGNPGGIDGLEDLADDGLLVGVCATGVPCGDFAREALAKAGISAAIDTEEADVRALASKVAIGELDAAITYLTDVAGNAELEGVAIPAADNVVATYPIAVLADAPNPDGGAEFVAFVLSTAGRSILAAHGFELP